MSGPHSLSRINPEDRTATCAVCGPGTRIKRNRGGWRCLPAAQRGRSYDVEETRRKPWRALKGDTCERCGFVPTDARQLDAHHRDGDKRNNAKPNVETLCANCHRITPAEGKPEPRA